MIGRLVATLALAGCVSAPTTGDIRTIPEAEMTARELDKSYAAPGSAKPIKFAELSQLGYRYAYVEAFRQKIAIPGQPAMPGHGPGAGAIVMTAAAIDGIARGVHTPRNDALVGVAIALDVASFVLGGSWNEKVRKALREEHEAFKKPSLYLLGVSDAVPIDGMTAEQAQEVHEQELRRHFDTARGVLENTALDCEPAYYNSTSLWGSNVVRGSHAPGFFHWRSYVCAHPREDLGMFETARLARRVMAQRIEDGRFFTHINYPAITDNDALLRRLGITSPDEKRNAARTLLTALAPNLPAAWFAIYSAENASGEWKLFVSQRGQTIEFEPPSDPYKTARRPQ